MDAICHGFQHLASLNIETLLSKELELVVNRKDGNSHKSFDFLLHKLRRNSDMRIEKVDLTEKKGSYLRLKRLVIRRKG